MNILLVHNYYQSHLIGGEDTVFNAEVSALSKKINLETFSVRNDEIQFPSILWQMFGCGNQQKRLKKAIISHKADIVHFHNTFPLLSESAIKTAKNTGAKVVVTLHNYRPWCINGTFFRDNNTCELCCVNKVWPGIKNKCYKNSYIISIAASLLKKKRVWLHDFDHVDKFIVLSQHQRRKILSLGINENKLVFKPHAVAVNHNKNTRDGLLFVGRLEEGKGYLDALRLMEKHPDISLTVIGDGPLSKVPYGSNVTLLGSLAHDEVQKWYARVKYLLAPSKYYETFGLTILESMSAGTPVIGYPVGTRNDWIEPGKTGWYLPVDLKEVINSSNWNEMSDACKKYAQNFGEEKLIEAQISLYESLL